MGRRQITTDQRGIVSIMVTMSLIVVVSLIVLAFAQIARREQRLSLDNQLSTQAYYAAESGVNEAQAWIAQELANGQPVPTDTSCANANDNKVISAENDVKYTCIQINPTPTTLQVVTGRSPKALLLRAFESNNLGNIKVRWFVAEGVVGGNMSACQGAATGFTPKGSWNCPYDVLRFDLVRANILSRDALRSNTRSGFAVPDTGSAAAPINSPAYPATIGTKDRAKCETYDANNLSGSYCEVTFVGMATGDYYIRLSTMYTDNVAVQITRTNNGKFADSQVQIDSTGKARDVLRRVRASISLTSGNALAPAAITSGESICKLGKVEGSGYNNGGCVVL